MAIHSWLLLFLSTTTPTAPLRRRHVPNHSPDSNWSFDDNGTYTISLRATRVSNTNGIYVEATTLGQFNVGIFPTPNNQGVGFINGLYQSILDRTSDPTGFAYWSALYNTGASKTDIFNGIWDSLEHRTEQVMGYYVEFLNRAADPAGLAFWVAQFAQGASEADVIAGFINSSEYRIINGGTASSVIAAIYKDLLGRDASESEIESWIPTYDSKGAGAVAMGVTVSPEYQMDLVNNDFIFFLNRKGSQGELDVYAEMINTTGPLSEQTIASDFAVSSAFYVRTETVLPPPLP